MLQVLKHGDGRCRGLIADLDEWLGRADHLYMRFLDRVSESPFTHHEVAATVLNRRF